VEDFLEIQKNKPSLTKLLRLTAGFLIAGLFLFLAFRKVDWALFSRTIQSISSISFLSLLLLSTFGYFIRALRWKSLLPAEEPRAGILSVFLANMAGYLGNSYLPARMGELLRSYLVGKGRSSQVFFVLGTAVVERVVDMLALVTGMAVILLFNPTVPDLLRSAFQGMALIAVVGLAFLLIFPSVRKWVEKGTQLLPIPVPIRSTLLRAYDHLQMGLRQLRSLRRAGTFFAYTAIIWILDTIGVMLLASAAGFSLSMPQAFFFLACLGVSSAIPFTPGNIGVYQFVAELVLVPFGLLRSQALAFSLILQAIPYIVVTIWGGIGLWHYRKILLKFRQEQTGKQIEG
jgi:glycosyltransferase 2 family protein